MNIGLYLNDEILNFGRPKGNNFTEPCCVIRERIGDLMNTNDIWYDLTLETNADNLYKELENISTKYVTPYLNKYNSRKDIFWEIINKMRNSANEIECLFHNGYKEQAWNALEKEIKGAKNEHYLGNLLKIKAKFEKDNKQSN